MPRLRRRQKVQRRAWGPQHFCQVEHGYDFLGNAFGDAIHGGVDLETLREFWSEHGADITAGWIAEHPCSRPWAWWVVERGMDGPPEDGDEPGYLKAHKLLRKDELAAYEAAHKDAVAFWRGRIQDPADIARADQLIAETRGYERCQGEELTSMWMLLRGKWFASTAGGKLLSAVRRDVARRIIALKAAPDYWKSEIALYSEWQVFDQH